MTVAISGLRFLFLLPKITLAAREGAGILESTQGEGPWGKAHLEAQQDAQVPGRHILNLVEHVEIGLCGQGHGGVLWGGRG